MPIVTAPAGRARLSPTNGQLRRDLAAAIAQLTFDELWRDPQTIAESGSVRIDIQGPWSAGPGQNIQAQVGGSSIAAMRLANTLAAAVGAAHQGAVVAAVGNALTLSENSGFWQNVTGTSP